MVRPEQCPPVLRPFIDNRLGFLAGILRFCWNANEAELAEMKNAIRKREAKLRPNALSAVERDRAEEAMNRLAAQREQILHPATRRSRMQPSKLDEKTRVDLAEIEKRIQSIAVSLSRPAKRRGRPRAEANIDWIAGTWAVMSARSSMGWTWKQATIASGLKPTKANIRTVQRREDQFARLIREKVRLPIESEF
jgi:hypothetical protein